MGGVVGKALSGVGGSIGDVFLSPLKTLFGNSCEGVCVGTWDLICFIEHLCISSIIRLAMVSGLTFLTLLFFYLLFQVGIIQCVVRGFCKMSCAACHAYWAALEGFSCLLWHKLKNTKRTYRGHRHYDLEEAYSSSGEDSSGASFDDNRKLRRMLGRKRSLRDRREHIRKSLHPVRWRTKSGRSHRHVRLNTREMSVSFKGSRRLRSFRKTRNKIITGRQRMW